MQETKVGLYIRWEFRQTSQKLFNENGTTIAVLLGSFGRAFWGNKDCTWQWCPTAYRGYTLGTVNHWSAKGGGSCPRSEPSSSTCTLACRTYNAGFVSAWEISWHHWLHSFCRISNDTLPTIRWNISPTNKNTCTWRATKIVTAYVSPPLPVFLEDDSRIFSQSVIIHHVKRQSLKAPREFEALWLRFRFLCPTRCGRLTRYPICM